MQMEARLTSEPVKSVFLLMQGLDSEIIYTCTFLVEMTGVLFSHLITDRFSIQQLTFLLSPLMRFHS